MIIMGIKKNRTNDASNRNVGGTVVQKADAGMVWKKIYKNFTKQVQWVLE